MKGTVVMRFVGNRQEPEAETKELDRFLFEPLLSEDWWNEYYSFLILENKRMASMESWGR